MISIRGEGDGAPITNSYNFDREVENTAL